MKSEEAKKRINKKIKACRKEKIEENAGTLIKILATFGIFEASAAMFSKHFPDLKWPFYITATIIAYAVLTRDGSISFEYTNVEYLNFLKEIREVLENNENIFQEIDESEFEKELAKVYRLEKNS